MMSSLVEPSPAGDDSAKKKEKKKGPQPISLAPHSCFKGEEGEKWGLLAAALFQVSKC
jgi:hypothetical protein